VNEDCLKLTAYFGERDRFSGGFLADALIDIYARHELQTSLVLRAVEGFGAKHHRHTDRLLSLSEDMPLAAVAVDARERIEAAHAEVTALGFEGLVTLERARLLTEPFGLDEFPGALGAREPSEELGGTKLTVYMGRRSQPGFQAVVELLHARGVEGATVLLGVDGTAHGARARATFFGRNQDVPVMIIAVGDGARIAGLLPELGAMLERPFITLERVQICKRDGVRLATPEGRNKLMVFGGAPLAGELVRRLRRAGAAGATSLRGIWGYHGDHAPHGDSLWQLRRHVPHVTVLVDTPERTAEWFAIVDELTAETGLVTSEIVPSAV
jgi:PII-like signaling protein